MILARDVRAAQQLGMHTFTYHAQKKMIRKKYRDPESIMRAGGRAYATPNTFQLHFGPDAPAHLRGHRSVIGERRRGMSFGAQLALTSMISFGAGAWLGHVASRTLLSRVAAKGLAAFTTYKQTRSAIAGVAAMASGGDISFGRLMLGTGAAYSFGGGLTLGSGPLFPSHFWRRTIRRASLFMI